MTFHLVALVFLLAALIVVLLGLAAVISDINELDLDEQAERERRLRSVR